MKKIDCSAVIPLLRKGLSRKEAARALGIRYDVVLRWVQAYEEKHRVIFEYDNFKPPSLYRKGGKPVPPWSLIRRHTPIGFSELGVYEVEQNKESFND